MPNETPAVYIRRRGDDQAVPLGGSRSCQTYSDSWTSLGSDGAFDLGDIYLPMGDIDLSGDWDCRDWLKEGVDWWRKEIAFYAKITSNKVSCRSKETESATWLKVTMGI